MWAGEATPLLGPEGPLPARGRDDPSVLWLYFENDFKDLHKQGFLQLRLKAHDAIFNSFSTSAAECIDGTCSLPQ